MKHRWLAAIRYLPIGRVAVCSKCLCRVRRRDGTRGGITVEYLPKDVDGWENASRRAGECK